MTKEQFLTEFSRHLRPLTALEKSDIMQDYEDHFDFGMEEGKTEDEIAASLGSPKQLAREILAEYHIDKMEASKSTGSIFRAVWSVIGLGFVNLVLVLGPFIALIGLLFGGWAIGVSFTLSPLLVFINAIFNPGTFEWLDLFMSLALCGLGFFISIGMYYVTLNFKNLTLRYLKYNVSVVKGGK